tara:strand:+ start:4044 stop:4745 length:702 start_codon:yes stop_codon:yes gene_type:complete
MQATTGSISQVNIPPVYNNVVDGDITLSEFNQKVYHLQCQYKDLVYKITNKWRYGIFCPEDSEVIIEIKALLRILICYGIENVSIEAGSTSELPEAYQDYLTFSGTNLNDDFGGVQASLPSPVNTGDYFFITSPYTDQYYVLKATEGFYSGDQVLPLDLIVYQLDQGDPIIQFGIEGQSGTYLLLEVLTTGNQEDLDAAITAEAGVEVTSAGLTDAQVIKIVKRIEKLLQCSH